MLVFFNFYHVLYQSCDCLEAAMGYLVLRVVVKCCSVNKGNNLVDALSVFFWDQVAVYHTSGPAIVLVMLMIVVVAAAAANQTYCIKIY